MTIERTKRVQRIKYKTPGGAELVAERTIEEGTLPDGRRAVFSTGSYTVSHNGEVLKSYKDRSGRDVPEGSVWRLSPASGKRSYVHVSPLGLQVPSVKSALEMIARIAGIA